MMHMPRRNVTRFFIPLIDVLILLFCIFLLMEFNSETKAEKQGAEISEKSEALQFLEEEHAELAEKLAKLEETNPNLVEVAKLREELDRLREANRQSVQRAFMRVIDVDGKDGSIAYFDPRKPNEPPLRIVDAETARKLIEQHKVEAKGRELYYYFMYPRMRSVYPTFGQEQQYLEWFKSVANSLVKVG